MPDKSVQKEQEPKQVRGRMVLVHEHNTGVHGDRYHAVKTNLLNKINGDHGPFRHIVEGFVFEGYASRTAITIDMTSIIGK